MKVPAYLEYKVEVSKDKESGLVVAEVPALGIADDGVDHSEAIGNIQQMVAFHLECLAEEGASIPLETRRGEGLYLRVKRPARAAQASI